MGLFDRMKDSEKLEHGWKRLSQVEEVRELVRLSQDKPVVIFKHSIRCGASAMAKWQLEQDWDFEAAELDLYYLDLIRYRSVSDQVSRLLGVVHQSPQIIVLKKGEVIFHASHYRINISAIRSALEIPSSPKV
jgi:bacillithiol system protein YtxJ